MPHPDLLLADSEPRPPAVFISYSHDSPEHIERVLAVANRLRADGVDAQIDQYEVSPPEGWPRWMSNRIAEADFVLVVCTETYARRFEGREEAGKGMGAGWGKGTRSWISAGKSARVARSMLETLSAGAGSS